MAAWTSWTRRAPLWLNYCLVYLLYNVVDRRFFFLVLNVSTEFILYMVDLGKFRNVFLVNFFIILRRKGFISNSWVSESFNDEFDHFYIIRNFLISQFSCFLAPSSVQQFHSTLVKRMVLVFTVTARCRSRLAWSQEIPPTGRPIPQGPVAPPGDCRCGIELWQDPMPGKLHLWTPRFKLYHINV